MISDALIAIAIFYSIIVYLIMLGHKIEYNDKKHLDPVDTMMFIMAPMILPIVIGMMLAENDKDKRNINK